MDTESETMRNAQQNCAYEISIKDTQYGQRNRMMWERRIEEGLLSILKTKICVQRNSFQPGNEH